MFYMKAEFSNIFYWSNTGRKHIPKSRCSYFGIDFKYKR